MRHCRRQPKWAAQPCGGQMVLETLTLMNAGKWTRSLNKADGDGRGFVSYEPPGAIRGSTWVCLQCGNEERG